MSDHILSDKEIFGRAQLLLGDEAMGRLARRRVIIFGIGGVGSWAAEGLVRTGLRNLTIVDPDHVAPTNVNRQLMATAKTIGRLKVEALRERLLDINPDARIETRTEMFSEEAAPLFNLEDYDYIIDAIDSLKDKALLILKATETGRTFYSSMGAALKIDPTRIKVGEFWKVEGCPLAAALRRKFRRGGTMPQRRFLCVYSPELLSNEEATLETCDYKVAINGSLAHITAIFGFTLAGLVIQDVAKG